MGSRLTLRWLRFKGSHLLLRLSCDRKLDLAAGDICLEFHSRLAQERVRFPFHTMKAADSWILCCLDLKTVPLKSLTWDVFYLAGEEKVPVYISYIYRLFLSFIYRGAYQAEDGCRFFAGNDREGMLCFSYRKQEVYEKPAFHLKELLAWLCYHLLKPFWDSRRIWLVYEKFCMSAQDNGFYFFRYCMENQGEKRARARIYYLLTEDSPDLIRLAPYKDHVVCFGSIKHMIYLQASRLLISTDNRMQAYILRMRGSILKHALRSKPFVFLQHGVTAMKKVDFFYGKGMPASCDLFIVTSAREAKIVEEHFGYEKEEIAVCGFARWDVFFDKSAGSRRILIMPTWRSWLENSSPSEFGQSEYYRNYMALLSSSRLSKLLQDYDAELLFYLHSKFREFIGTFHPASSRIRLVSFGELPVNELLMQANLLVTDYSSVCWDMLYLGKPVLFYQFDREAYLEAHGSYLDLEKELIGPCAASPDELTDCIQESIENGFILQDQYAEKRREIYPDQDQKNAERIFEAIRKKYE